MAVTTQIHGDLAVVTIDNPPVNAINHAVRQGLWEARDQADDNDQVKAVLLICAGRSFFSGADINEFGKPPIPPFLPDVLNHIETAIKPWIAAIHGQALGGGLELALACHYRIATPSAKFSFPEVNLGLIPGAGGTVRTPRLIATANALSMIVEGKPIGADRAIEWGLIDALAQGDLRTDALAFADACKKQVKPSPLTARNPIAPLSNADWDAITLKIEAKARGNNTPMQALEAIRESATMSAELALKTERQRFLSLTRSEQSKALRYIFFAERSAAKLPELKNVSPRPIRSVGVIGGGLMGSGIATATLLAGLPAVMIEQSEDALARGIANVHKNLDASLSRSIISQSEHEKAISALTGSTNYAACQNVDMVIEAVFEDMDVKKAVFRQLEAVTRPDAILLTNTSYLDANAIGTVLADASRFLGLHFFSPAHIMKLVEVIRTENVSLDVLTGVLDFAKRLGKISVISGVCDGFIGNRIMSSYRRALELLAEEGASPFDIDIAMKNFGMPMGLFEMQDLAGLDISYAMRKRQAATRDPNAPYCALGDHLVEAGYIGRKTGKGWYIYEGKNTTPNPLVFDLIATEQKAKGITPRTFSLDEILDRFLSTMWNEGNDILAEGIAASPEAIDVVMVNGFGFPRWKGGPMYQQGLARKPESLA